MTLQHKPLAEILRPKCVDEYVGQSALIGNKGILRTMIETGHIPSMILWGPPGVGKTSLAYMLSLQLMRPFYTLSAIQSGVKEVREIIKKAKEDGGTAILFIDEIHRFSKSQQDSLLGAVEQGIITLIGATTENPSFEVISPLLSRAQVYTLQPLSIQELDKLAERAANYYTKHKIQLYFDDAESLYKISGGDARKLYNLIELCVNHSHSDEVHITTKLLANVQQHQPAMYDKKGEMHYDIVSAFIKSIRASDPNAAVYWLARMIEGGEDVKFIARRMLILAAEDIGNANPNALLLANTCFDAVNKIGWPESRIILSQTAVYLANSAKSNSTYMAINKAQALVKTTGNLPVPLHLRNAPTSLMQKQGYGSGYKYAHDYPEHFVDIECMPQGLEGTKLYVPASNTREQADAERIRLRWKDKYK